MTESEQVQPNLKEFINSLFFASLEEINNQLVKLEKEEITMKELRNFILEQRVRFAEEVIKFYHDLSLRATEMEHSLLTIGKHLLENQDEVTH